MAIQRSTPTAINTYLNTSGLTSSTTAFQQTDVVNSGTSSNVTDIVANWTILAPAHTPSASTVINVFCWGSNDDSGYPGGSATAEVITGTAGTFTASANGSSVLRFLKSTLLHTASITYRDEASVVSALGFVPRRWGLVFQNQCGTTLGTSGHAAENVETYYN